MEVRPALDLAPNNVDALNVVMAAAELGVSRSTVLYQIKAGRIAAQKIGEGRTSSYAIARTEIERLKAQRAS
ncbi:helix-turn-helix domain-containing protein [Nocardioides bruguierae]|uniref:Helix-turn-helix domain-containing protein n=1 Tax=Nocardioides bruguierae TaxID=2945102 RepID=A0A9X2IGQ1_9ACTN|nr:helix-turn-helix domain-containing protein [Nocardioides bruguierae]MCM0622597.1 helix-turn-helix domain-containing protein [Nocardioides bruguierae]